MVVFVIILSVLFLVSCAYGIIAFVQEPWTDYTESMRKSVEMDRREARANAMYNHIMSAPRDYHQRKDDDVGDDMFRSEQLRIDQEQARLASTGFEFGGFDTSLPDNPTQFADEMNSFSSSSDGGFGF